MVLKVRAFENNEEKLIPLSAISTGVRNRERIDVTTIVGNAITLAFTPLTSSEFVALNGLFLTDGATYDYTISGNIITFNGGVLTQTGHVLINYSY